MTNDVSRISMAFHLKEALQLPDMAVDWLMDLWDTIQVFDDIVDGDEVSRQDMLEIVVKSLVTMPTNPFYAANVSVLQPIIATAILKWKAADDVELAGEADEKSFVWRASYYDVILTVVLLCHGWDVAMEKAASIMRLYGEDYTSYKEEF